MLTLEQIRQELTDRNIQVISERTGINSTTLYHIARGANTNPKYQTIKTLSDYFEKGAAHGL